MELSIIIVNYNVRHYLVQCLESVQRALKGIEAEVWVVDNASTDGSVAAVRKHFPSVHVIENKVNVGFSRANNSAICQAGGDFILMLNPDTIVGGSTFKDALGVMRREARAGICGVMMLNRNGSFALESRRGLPTPLTALYKMCGLCRLFPRSRRFGKYYMQYLDRSEASQIEVVSGAFMLIRKAMIDEVGLMDEDYFMYGEDVDLSYRSLKGGWQNWYQPTPIVHYKGESTKTNSAGYVFNFYNAMLIFINKHFRHRYRGMIGLVKVAVYVHGALVMMLKLTMKLLASTRACLLSLVHARRAARDNAESMIFVGSDEAWEEVSVLCERNGLIAYRCGSLEEVAGDEHTEKALYLTMETDTTADRYTEVLATLRETHERGLCLNLGTYSLKHKVLILPNDCFE